MKTRLLFLVAGFLFVCGCAPKLFRYEHAVVSETSRVTIILRSTESNDAQGKPLRRAKVGLPIKSAIFSTEYTVGIFTPLQYQPFIFLRAEDNAKNPLQLRGTRIRELDPRAGVRVVHGYTHEFDLGGARAGLIEFEVTTEADHVLGREKLDYQIVVRGHKWEVDTL